MRIVIAVQEPHLRGTVAPCFEAAPYYLAVDTAAGRTTVLLHPVQYQAECSAAGLVQRLRPFAPEAVFAGSFAADVHEVASTLRITLKTARGRAGDIVDHCAAAALSGR